MGTKSICMFLLEEHLYGSRFKHCVKHLLSVDNDENNNEREREIKARTRR